MLTATVEPQVKDVRLDTTAPAGAASITITRTGPSGTEVAVRTWERAPIVPGPVIARDFEVPIGVPLTYRAETFTAPGVSQGVQTTTITVAADGCGDTWLTDLIRAGNTQQIVMESLPELAYPVEATVHDILARRAPIVASDIAKTPELELTFLTATDAQRAQARNALGNGIPVLLRTPPENGIGNMYLSVLEFAEQRIVTLATTPDRRFRVRARQVDRPDPVLFSPQPPQTYELVRSNFADYADLRSSRATYDALAYDWTGTAPADVFPWPPADV